MWLKRCPLYLLLLCFYAFNVAIAYIRSSSPQFEAFIRAEDEIVAGLGKYVLHETERLEIIRNSSGYEKEVPIVEERIKILKEFYDKADANASAVTDDIRALRVHHPTSALVAVRNFVSNWQPLLSNETLYGFRLLEFLNISRSEVVGLEDLSNICGELVQIQLFYNLSASDVLRGNVLGVKGEPLTLQDAYKVGLSAKESTKLRLAREWFELVLSESKKIDNKTTVNIPLLLSELAILYSVADEPEKAVVFANEAYALNETNDIIYRRFMQVQNEVVPQLKNFDDSAPPFWKNMTKICQANSTFQGPLKWYHRCRLRCSVVPIRRYREEILSIAPYVSVFHDLIGDDVIEDIKNLTNPELSNKQHFLYNNFHSAEMLNETTGSGRILNYLAGEISGLNASFSRRLPKGSPLRVLRFGFAGRAYPHHQFTMIDRRMAGAGQKVATVMFYLTDVDKGGATALMDIGIRFQPKKGSALLMFLKYPSGENDMRLTKAECFHAVGTKWMVEKDIYYHRNKLARPCGRKPLGNQIGLDRMVHKYRHCGF